MEALQYHEFTRQMSRAVEVAQRVIDSNKRPVIPHNVAHTYSDKFALVERAANSTLASLVTILEALGLDQEKMQTAVSWAKSGSTVTFRFQAEESLAFLKTADRKENSKVQHVSKFMGVEHVNKTVTTITEHFWKYSHTYSLVMYKGNAVADGFILQERSGSAELVTTGNPKVAPFPEMNILPPEDVSVQSIFSLLKDRQGIFSIDRTKKDCHTPAQNGEILDLQKDLRGLSRWMRMISHHFKSRFLEKIPSLQQDPKNISIPPVGGVFIPVLPMFEQTEETEAEEKGSKALLSSNDVDKFLKEHQDQLQSAMRNIGTIFPSPSQTENTLLSAQEAGVVLLSDHLIILVETLVNCVEYIESMLHAQLREAIGKEITPELLEEYMQFHYRKLYNAEIIKPFSYDIKREGYAPEGTLSIVAPSWEGDVKKEISTCVMERSGENAVPMRFRLSAATMVEMKGSQFMHGYLSHRFSDSRHEVLRLSARARQFSSFVLLVGRIAARDEFEPKHALILQNKDVVLIPLLLDPLPTAKAFRDAIESLSPEQKDFARAIRAMQLESTLFAVGIVEIKPQLELLLKLPQGALTKEIKLTQDLVKLFIEYQVPCDLVTYDGDESSSLETKLERVKKHVEGVLKIIKDSEDEDLERSKREAVNAVQNTVTDVFEECNDSIDGSTNDLMAKSMTFSAAAPKPRGGRMFKRMASPQMVPPPVSTAKVLYESAPMHRMAPGSAQPPPRPQQQVEQQLQSNLKQPSKELIGTDQEPSDNGSLDYTKLPAKMDARVEMLDPDASLRPTKINVGDDWELESFRNLLSRTPSLTNLGDAELRSRRAKAMDLLDALSRSGDLPLISCQLHIVVASTHCFDKTVLQCVLQENVNPIERIERSSLIIASSILGKRPVELISGNAMHRVEHSSPILFDESIASLEN